MQVDSFGDVIEAVDKLSLDEQESLLDILHKRIIENRRAQLVQDIQTARKEFQSGDFEATTPDEIVKEILS